MKIYSIKTRMIFLTTIGILGMLIIGATGRYMQGFIHQENEISRLSQASAGDISNILRIEERYIRSTEAHLVQESKNYRSQFTEVIEKITESTQNTEIHGLINAMKALEKKSAELFEAIVANTVSMNRAKEELRDTWLKCESLLQDIIKIINDEEAALFLNGDFIAPKKDAVRKQFKQLLGIRNEVILNLNENLFLTDNAEKYGSKRQELKKQIDVEAYNTRMLIKAVNIDGFAMSWKKVEEKMNAVESIEKKIADFWQENQSAIKEIIEAGEKSKKIADQIVALSNSKVQQAGRISNFAMITGVLAIVLLSGILNIFIYRSLATPIAHVVDGLKDIAHGKGDLTYRLPVGGKDELGELARWFNVFIENLQEMIHKIVQHADQLDSSADSLSGLSGDMAKAARDSSHQSDSVAAAAIEMSISMGSVAAAMEQTSANIEMVAGASEEMTATINEIAQNSEKARSISEQAVVRSKSTTEQVDELGRAAIEISQITEAINEISEQTNLLALNATIEAARAGEAGKGFAVVANEIKELARQTAGATGQIREKISKIQHKTEMTIQQISEFTGVINVVDEIVSNIAGSIEEQSITTKEIANNIAQAAKGVLEVNKNVSQSSAVSDQIAREIAGVNLGAAEIMRTSSRIDTNANKLSELATTLKEAVQRFKI